jgi:hypothetical protein
MQACSSRPLRASPRRAPCAIALRPARPGSQPRTDRATSPASRSNPPGGLSLRGCCGSRQAVAARRSRPESRARARQSRSLPPRPRPAVQRPHRAPPVHARAYSMARESGRGGPVLPSALCPRQRPVRRRPPADMGLPPPLSLLFPRSAAVPKRVPVRAKCRCGRRPPRAPASLGSTPQKRRPTSPTDRVARLPVRSSPPHRGSMRRRSP